MNMVVYILKCCVLQEDVAAFLDKQDALDYCKKRNIDFEDKTESNVNGNHTHTVCTRKYELTVLPLIEGG